MRAFMLMLETQIIPKLWMNSCRRITISIRAFLSTKEVIFLSTWKFKSCNLLEPPANTNLKIVRIHFATATFDRITKDSAAKFADMLSAIGGTMGLLTGFSIISGVEIIYFMFKIFFDFIQKKYI